MFADIKPRLYESSNPVKIKPPRREPDRACFLLGIVVVLLGLEKKAALFGTQPKKFNAGC